MNQRSREARFNAIRRVGCLACLKFGVWTAPDVHHLNGGGHAGQKRRGDEFTIGLCPWHHRGVPSFLSPLVGPSLAKESRAFRAAFGTDDELLAKQNDLIAANRVRLVQCA